MHVQIFPSHIYKAYFFIYSSFDFTYFQVEIAVKQASLTRLSTVGKWTEVFSPHNSFSRSFPISYIFVWSAKPGKYEARVGMGWERRWQGFLMLFLSLFIQSYPHWSPLFTFDGFLFVISPLHELRINLEVFFFKVIFLLFSLHLLPFSFIFHSSVL